MSQLQSSPWVVVLLCALTFPNVAAAETTQGFAARELAFAHDFLSRAAAIVARTPSDGMTAAMMVRGNEGPAGRFYEDERGYQKALMNRARVAGGTADIRDEFLNAHSFFKYLLRSATRGGLARRLQRIGRTLRPDT